MTEVLTSENATIEKLYDFYQEIQKTKKKYEADKAHFDFIVLKKYGGNYPTGTHHAIDNGYDVKIVTPKKIEWDQSALAELMHHEDAADLISVTYKVSETNYKAAPPNVRPYFDNARTEGTGKPQIEITAKE